MAARAAVVGGSGYTGAEILRVLDAHPAIEPVLATSREFAGRPVSDVYPNLTVDLVYTDVDTGVLADVDIAFLAVPHGAAMGFAPDLLARGVRLIDLSADHRLRDAEAYASWFGGEHAAPGLLDRWIYGLPELYRDRIAGAAAVANPGCYPTAALLALSPLVRAGHIDPATVVITAASGVSGAGRTPSPALHFPHADGSFKAYGLPAHKHVPEIEQELGVLAGASVRITFVPHLAPMSRGLLATCVADLRHEVDPAEVAREMYANEPFVRVVDELPETKHTMGSNLALLSYRVDERTGRVIAVAAIDNLGKGAAGQAVQNANLMLGLPEGTGLARAAVFP